MLTKLTLLAVILQLVATTAFAECRDAEDYADDAYGYARRAYLATDLPEAKFYAKKAMLAAEESKGAADECGCDKAGSFAEDAYSYARRAYRAESLDEAQHYAKKARNSADDARIAAQECEGED